MASKRKTMKKRMMKRKSRRVKKLARRSRRIRGGEGNAVYPVDSFVSIANDYNQYNGFHSPSENYFINAVLPCKYKIIKKYENQDNYDIELDNPDQGFESCPNKKENFPGIFLRRREFD